MAKPLHISMPTTITVGAEGATATISPGPGDGASQPDKSSRFTNAIDAAKTKLGIRKDTIADGHEGPILYAGRFGALQEKNINKVVEVVENQREAVGKILNKWADWCIGADGLDPNAGNLDKTMMSMYGTMLELKPDERLNSKFLSNPSNYDRKTHPNFNKLSEDQIKQLLQVMKSAEYYMAGIIGMEIRPLPHSIDNTATGHRERFKQYAEAGLKWVGDRMKGLGDKPTSMFDDKQIAAKEREKRRQEIEELFNNSSGFGREVSSTGFKGFRKYFDESMDVAGFNAQNEFVLLIRKTRLEMVKQLSAGEIRADSVSPEARSLSEKILRSNPEYADYKSIDFDKLPIEVQQMLEADANLQHAQNMATENGEELHERNMLEIFTEGKLESLRKGIEKLDKGGAKADESTLKKAQKEADEKEEAFTAKDTEIGQHNTQIGASNANILIWQTNLDDLKNREANIRTNPNIYANNAAGAAQRTQDLDQISRDIKEEEKRLTDANTKIADLNVKILTATPERAKAEKARDKAKKAFEDLEKQSGQDEEKKKVLEAIESIVQFEGSRNELAHNLLDLRNEPSQNYIQGTNKTESNINFNTLRRQLGIHDNIFKEMVGETDNENLNLRLCLARIHRLTFDEAQIKGDQTVNANSDANRDLDRQIWAIIKSNRQHDMVDIAKKVWLTMLDSALTRDKPTLDMNSTYTYGERDIRLRSKPETLPKYQTERIQTVLREKKKLEPGINTVADYIKLASGDIVAICVDTKGRNFLIDQNGKNLGRMERNVIENGATVTHPASSEQVRILQSDIQHVLALRRIRAQMLPVIGHPGEYQFHSSLLGMLDLIEEDGVLKAANVLGAGQHQNLEEFLTKAMGGRQFDRETGREAIFELEQRGLELIDRKKEVGAIKILEGEVLVGSGKGFLEYDDPTTVRPSITLDYEMVRINLGENDDVMYVKNTMRPGIPGSVASNSAVDINNPPAVDIPQLERLYEAAFFHLSTASSDRKKQIAANMPQVVVDNIIGGRSFQIGLEPNGNMVIRDVTDFIELNPPVYNANDYLNEQFTLGLITDQDMRAIRQSVGKQLIFAENQRLKRQQ